MAGLPPKNWRQDLHTPVDQLFPKHLPVLVGRAPRSTPALMADEPCTYRQAMVTPVAWVWPPKCDGGKTAGQVWTGAIGPFLHAGHAWGESLRAFPW